MGIKRGLESCILLLSLCVILSRNHRLFDLIAGFFCLSLPSDDENQNPANLALFLLVNGSDFIKRLYLYQKLILGIISPIEPIRIYSREKVLI